MRIDQEITSSGEVIEEWDHVNRRHRARAVGERWPDWESWSPPEEIRQPPQSEDRLAALEDAQPEEVKALLREDPRSRLEYEDRLVDNPLPRDDDFVDDPLPRDDDFVDNPLPRDREL